MDNNNRFYREHFLPYYEALNKFKFVHVEIAEKYFHNLLQIIITISSGMVAFLAIMKPKLFPSNIISGFITAIVLAIISIALLAYNNMKYADQIHKRMVIMHDLAREQSWHKIKIMMDSRNEEFLKKKDAGWQATTLFFGVFSTAICLFAMGLLIRSVF